MTDFRYNGKPIIVPNAARVSEELVFINANCTEHIWAEMSKQFQSLQQPSQTLEQLAKVLQTIWQARTSSITSHKVCQTG